jgi:hypothetical protein
MVRRFFSLSFLFLSLLLLLLFLLSLLLLFLLLPLFCFCSCLLSVLCCHFALLQHPPTDYSVATPPVPFSVGSSTSNKKHNQHRIHIQWIRLYLLSRLCHGLLLCHSKVIFVMKPMFSMHHWKPSTTSFITLLPCTKAPSTLFGSVPLFAPSLVDLERIMKAIVFSWTYSKLQNLFGIVPLFPMVMVCVPQPMSQI